MMTYTGANANYELETLPNMKPGSPPSSDSEDETFPEMQ